ncbi:MAG: hypothetical protein MJY84_01805 [Bacteroidales bacterium]|nr:hypothetical protein [Bacteroidales bacterium]
MTDKLKDPEKKKTVTETVATGVKSISQFVIGDKNEYALFQCDKCGRWHYIKKQNIISRTLLSAYAFGKELSSKSNNVVSKTANAVLGAYSGGIGGATNFVNMTPCSQCDETLFIPDDMESSYKEFESIIEQHQKAYSNLSDNPSELIDLLRFYSSIRDLPNEINTKVFDSIAQPEKLEHEYLENFLKIEPEDRQLLVFKDNLDVFPNKGCVVLPLRNRPKGLSFGQQRKPEKDVIYMLHPHRNNMYISAKSFLDEVFEDKLRELKKLLNAWGAEKIKIINETESKEKSQKSNSTVQRGEGELDGVPVEVESKKKESEAKSYSIAKKVEIEIHNNPTPNLPPYLPDDLVWYPNEEKWQDNYKERIERTNSMNYHAHYSEQRSKKSIEEEKTSLSVSGLGISQESLKEYEDASVSERDITINVKFYPMETYKQSVFSKLNNLIK